MGSRLSARALLAATSFAAMAAAFIPTGGASAAQSAPKWVANAKRVGPAAENSTVRLTVFIGLKNRDQLVDLIKSQNTKGSAQYGKYLTPEQFRQQFAPDHEKVTLVQNTLRHWGFHIGDTPKSGLFIEASGTVAQVKAAFGVTQQLYSYNGKILRSNAESPKLPAELQGVVSYIAGFDQASMLRKPAHISAREEAMAELSSRTAAAKPNPNAPPPPQSGIESPFCSNYWADHTATLSTAAGGYGSTIPWLVCGYTPQQMRQAYGSDKVTQTGKGVRVGIVDIYASPTIVQDTNRYSRNHGLPQLTYLNFQQMVPPGIYDVPADDPCGPQGWYGEETLDVQAVHSIAPDAFILYGGIACTDPGNSALYNMIDNHLVDIVTNSYSFNGEYLPPDFIQAENDFFLQAAAEGMSILFSSGDDGDLTVQNGIASGSFEATSPWVTAVGGTSLALKDSSGAKSEWGWGTYRAFLTSATVSQDGKSITTTGAAFPFSFYSGAGGGPSLSQLQPFYQTGVVPYSLSGYTQLPNGSQVWLQTPHRVTPDISLVGDPYTGFLIGETYTITGDPVLDAPCRPLNDTLEYCETSIGGTSLSSPLLAGVLALVNQARFQKGKPAVGFVNPALYTMQVGAPGSNAPIIDVLPPSKPVAVLRGYANDFTRVRVVTVNSYQKTASMAVREGYDQSYKVTTGYDEVTGLGTPNVPALINAFTN